MKEIKNKSNQGVVTYDIAAMRETKRHKELIKKGRKKRKNESRSK